MRFGCSTLLFGGYDLDTALDGIQEAGYEAIELCSIPGMGPHLEPGQSDGYYAEIKGKIAARGLTIESIGSTGDVIGAEGRERLRTVLRNTVLLGAPVVTTGSGGKAGDESTWRAFVAGLNDLTTACRETGVKISIKPHVGAAVHNSQTALRLRSETDNEWIGINFDPTHVFRHNDPPAAACRALKDHIFTLRFRDCKPPEDNPLAIGPVENQIPGKGVMPLDEIVAAMKQVPVEFVTVEMVGSLEFPLEQVQRIITETIEYMERAF